ncbi:PPi-type phosphoenolpyruvate carboxykinase [Seminavis robusta]|uniref:PPi-type phosphoenolpyruvate carboxykinase n=1 Tax=Seminavis robusta TaxID=568900 RepID=A0A9N8HQ85_9STRA|nr:PPi-type phosphoenolpyruvate carboxykinase [Seminavis robusta]|eukprot:Sro1169_g248610.1 PPi-type phosphoenolpyruvate carboxykinase (1196) ;mRNA; r:7401-11522
MVVADKKKPELGRYVGLSEEGGQAPVVDPAALQRVISVKLAAQGFSNQKAAKDDEILDVASDLFRVYREQSRLLENYRPPIDQRIQAFLNDALASTGDEIPQLPQQTLPVDRYGLARELSFPQGANEFHNSEIDSYRLTKNGVLHNPINDKRTTKGVFHVADYGLPIPADKIKVPLVTYQRLLKTALKPPADLNTLPYTSEWETPAETMVSLLLRPLACPEVPGVNAEKRLEVRFFVPGGCVSNLDFVESIFGNAGDPSLPENDSGLDTAHWTGTTGCVILAPHLRKTIKKELGLPNIQDATDEQKRTGMCWEDPAELYNGGKPFKITMRDERGIMVTILADNYFGYCKKEVKTQIGLTANVTGLAEEEHAGGALAFKSTNLGEKFKANPRYMQTIVPKTAPPNTYKFEDALKLLGDTVTLHPEGYATDKHFPDIHILPEDMQLNVHTQTATFTNRKTNKLESLRLKPNHLYVHPSGYKVFVGRHPTVPKWRLVGTLAEPTFCHKPSTVSGGGKSEISKSLSDAVLHGPIFIGEYEKDMQLVKEIFDRDYSSCILPQFKEGHSDPSRPILSMDRTLGSVIKLLTTDDVFTPEHNAFVESIPNHILAIVFAIKSSYRPEMGDNWKSHFTVDITNGVPGHELKLNERQLVGSYLRVGHNRDGTWRNYKMRQDFISAAKVQMEDDITASIVVPREQIKGLPEADYSRYPSLKISENVEYRLFQRPDDAIIPGFDKQTEIDMSEAGLFCSNFQPIPRGEEMERLTEELYFFDLFTEPMQKHMVEASSGEGVAICSAKPRLVDGKPTKNPRYLQVRPDITVPRDRYVAELGARLYRRLSVDEACVFPVAGVLSGRRNNPPDELNGTKIRPLAVYNPLHYQELPELFMDYVCCVTGKSPSTTGAGSEGALSKGPFNAIGATADLNNMLVSMLLTEYGGFSSAAGWIGPKYKVDHDISLLIPELWCRMTPKERDPEYLIKERYLEPIADFEYEGRQIPASRLGYRITKRFVHNFFCRIFDNPSGVFTEEMLQPEKQDMAVFVDGIENIAQAMEKSALLYFKDGIIEDACPPLRAVLHVMAYGHYNGKKIDDPAIRAMFTREALINSKWYKARLLKKQRREVSLWEKNVEYLESFLARPGYDVEAKRLNIQERLEQAKKEHVRVQGDEYLQSLVGTLGADLIHDGYVMNATEEGGIPTDIIQA